MRTASTRRWSSGPLSMWSFWKMLRMLLDGMFRDDELRRDAAVGAAFSHQLEYLALTRSERADRVVVSVSPDELSAALIALAYRLRRYLASDSKLTAWMFAAGIAAVVTSLFQAATGETMTYRAAHGASPAGVRTLFHVLNNADTIKIAFLAIMIGTASVLAAAPAQPAGAAG